MWRLARDSGGLDLNSPYSYLMVCRHFAATSVVADTGETLAGFVSAYKPPQTPDVVFVWQVTTGSAFRGQGLGVRMLKAVLVQAACREVRYMEATVTPGNAASRRTFAHVAADMGAPYAEAPCFPADLFPQGHEAEMLFRIGPFPEDGKPGWDSNADQKTNANDGKVAV